MADGERCWIVGVDGSPYAARAARWARGNAGPDVAEIRLVTAWSIPPLAFCSPMAGMHPDLGRRLRASAQEVVERAANEIGAADGIRLVTDVVRGRSSQALLTTAEGADLLVVGSRGQTGFQAFTLGSTAARVAAHAPCPVAVVPATAPLDPPQRIVVALAGSRHSVAALDHAVDLAGAHSGPGVHLVLVTVDDGDAGFGEPYDHLPLEDAQRSLVEATVQRRRPEGGDRIEIETRVATGSARQVLLDEAGDSDLLVVGRRGRGLAGSLRLGSVSHWLLAHSPVTVLTVPWTFDPGSSETDERT